MQPNDNPKDGDEIRSDQVGTPKLINLPTGKPHISFSEIRVWKECSYRHKLQFVDQVGRQIPGVHMDFGTAVHSACENFLKTKTMDVGVFVAKLATLWAEHAPLAPEAFTQVAFDQFKAEGLAILAELPAWLDGQFPGWEFVDAEHYLYERIEGHSHAFKGFIDCIIRAPGPKGKMLYWLLDFKTTSWGWSMIKKSDDAVRAQLVLYKNFWSTKTATDPKDVRCGFVLLKRTAKAGNRCELVTTSVGDVTTGRSLKVINNMLTSVKRGIALKNRASCTWCEYKDTPNCT